MMSRHKRMMRMGMVVLGMVVCLSFAQEALSAAYIKFDGIDGEVQDSQDKEHKDWIVISGFSQTIHREALSTTSGGGSREIGKAVIEDISFYKELDKASPKLAEACLKGTVIPTVTIHLTRIYRDKSVTYYTYELKNVMISSYNISGGDTYSNESLSLNFEEIKVTYKVLNGDGDQTSQVEFTWNVERGE